MPKRDNSNNNLKVGLTKCEINWLLYFVLMAKPVLTAKNCDKEILEKFLKISRIYIFIY